MVDEIPSGQSGILRGAIRTAANELLMKIAAGEALEPSPDSPWRSEAEQIDPKSVGRYDALLRGLTTFNSVDEYFEAKGNSLGELIWDKYGMSVFPSGSFRFGGMSDPLVEVFLSYILWERFGRPGTEVEIMRDREKRLEIASQTASVFRGSQKLVTKEPVTITVVDVIRRVVDGSLPVLPGQRST